MSRRFFILLLAALIGCGSTVLPARNEGKGKGPKEPPEPVQMGSRFYDSFERHISANAGAKYPWYSLNGYVAATARTGSEGYRGNTGEARNFEISSTDRTNFRFDLSTVWASFYIRASNSSVTAGDIIQFQTTSGVAKMSLKWTTTNKIKLTDTSGSDIATSSTTLAANTWYRVDAKCGTGASGSYELRIHADGSPGTSVDLTGTANLNTTNFGTLRIDVTDTGGTTHMDDIEFNDSGYIVDGSDYRIETIFPNGNGNYTSWTGDYTDVDDVEHDATTTEITTTTNLNRETVTLGDISLSAGESVISVMNVYHMRKTATAATEVQVIDRVGTTDRDSASFELAKNDVGDQDQIWFVIYDTKPGGGSWTESDVNGYEIGLEHNQSQARDIFCTAMNTNVLIQMPAAGGGSANAGRMTLLGVQ